MSDQTLELTVECLFLTKTPAGPRLTIIARHFTGSLTAQECSRVSIRVSNERAAYLKEKLQCGDSISVSGRWSVATCGWRCQQLPTFVANQVNSLRLQPERIPLSNLPDPQPVENPTPIAERIVARLYDREPVESVNM